MNIRRIICICTSLILIAALLTGCRQRGTGEQGIYDIYCLDREENKLCSYEWECPLGDGNGSIELMLGQLALMPDKVNLRQAVLGYEITGYTQSDGQLNIDVSDDYRNMSPTTEILVRAALVHSLCQLPDVDYVCITCGGEGLTDSQGVPIGRMKAEQFVDNSGNEINSYESVRLSLYFADATGTGLKKIVRTVEYNSNIALEKLVVEQLITGPNTDEYLGTINSQTKIINVTIKDGICYVSLDEAFLNIPEGISPELMIYSIVNSLVELPNVNKVMINIDGSEDAFVGDNLSLDVMYERNLELVE